MMMGNNWLFSNCIFLNVGWDLLFFDMGLFDYFTAIVAQLTSAASLSGRQWMI